MPVEVRPVGAHIGAMYAWVTFPPYTSILMLSEAGPAAHLFVAVCTFEQPALMFRLHVLF